MARFGDFDQYLDNAGDPLSNGKLYFYESGTTTPKTTYSDINNSIPNTNPVLLSAAGRQPNIFFDGVAKVILADNSDAQIAVRDPVGETATDFGDEWVATKIYNAVDVVLGSDGTYYRSLINGNQNNNPVTTSGSWTLLYSVEWNAGITYQVGAVVTYGSQQYQSLQNSNLNQNPASQTAYWVPLNFAWVATATYSEDQNVVGTDGILYTSLQDSNTGNDPATSPAYWVGTSAAAAASAVAAAASATAASDSETAAAASETAAAASETAAAASETAAAASESAAATSATNASNSASAASTSETNAAASETAAAASASAASTSETNAAASASAASTSETNAAASETAAAASETAAAASESAAATSETNAANSASAASTSASNASTSETNAASSATAAAGSATAASGSATAAAGSATDAADKYDEFDDRYLGEKASDPTLDNDGNALITGALYFNTSTTAMKVYTGSVWQDVAPVATTVTLSQVTDFPTQSGQSGKYLSTNGTTPTWETLTTDPTLGTLTKTFTTGESSTINLTSSVLAPVVSVTKEVPQSGVTNNNWDVNSTTENYTRINSAYATTLDFVGDLATASFVDSFSVAAQDTNPVAIAFSTNGTKMFIVGQIGSDVNEYDLSIGFDVSTATYSQSFSISAQDTNLTGIAFNIDGTKMFISGNIGDAVYEYTLSIGFDISTASYSQNFSVSAQDGTPTAISFNSDGTKMFVLGYVGQDVNEYTLSTGFDVSTATYSQNFSVSAQEATPTGMAFNANGTKMFIVGFAGDDVNEYTLGTGFDVSTASYLQSFSVASQETTPRGIAFNSSGTKMFIVGTDGDDVNEYYITPTTLQLGTGSFASADVGKTIEANDGAFVLTATDGSSVETTAPTSYDQVASGSWEMYGVVYNAADGDLELSGYSNLYDLSSASYDSVFFSVASQGTSPLGLNFNSSGTRMFVVDYSSAYIYQYNLSESFNITTAVYTTSFLLSSQTSAPIGVDFNSDGTKMFIASYNTSTLYQYTLSTGFDVSTASYDSVSLNVSAQQTNPRDLRFNSDGTKMFVVGAIAQAVSEYSLSSAFLLSTATFVDSFSVSSQSSTPVGLTFNTDGTKMFTTDQVTSIVDAYNLSTGFDVSTASYLNSLSTLSIDGSSNGIAFNADGSKMFIAGNTNDAVFQYSTGASYFPTGYQPVHTTSSIDSTYWTDINSMTADQAAGDGNVYYAISTDDRTTWTVIDNTDGERDIVRNNAGTWQYNSNGTYASETWTNATTNTELAALAEAMDGAVETTGYSINNASYDSVSFSISAQETTPQCIAFNTDGTKMFVVGYSGQDVNEYTLSTGFNISTASFVDSFSVASQETAPTAIAFNTDGTKMFIAGFTGDDVNEYTLSTAFDVSTASFVDSFSFAAQEDQVRGLTFNNTGTKMYVVGQVGDDVNEYTLSTGFDVSTASYSQNFSLASQDAEPRDIAFNADGTKMFITGDSNDSVYHYSLSIGYDISTASFVDSFSVAAQQTAPTGIAFNADGSKMFIVDQTNTAVYQYTTTGSTYTNQMDKTQLDAVTDPNHIALGDDLDLSIIFNMTSGTTVPSSDGVAINYDANVLNKGAVLGTDYDFDAPAGDAVRITALAGNNLKVRVV